MIKPLLIMLLDIGCVRKTTPEKTSENEPILPTNIKLSVQYDRLKAQFASSDSAVLVSHHSPNMPIKNPNTGKYYPHLIPFIEDGRINYTTSVQERKQLNKHDIEEIADILGIPAIDDSISAGCFQPRNAVIIFKEGRMSCFDFCFDCYGFSVYGNFDSNLIMDPDKYKKLFAFYKKLGFKYEME